MLRRAMMMIALLVVVCAPSIAAQEPTPSPVSMLDGIDGVEDAAGRTYQVQGVNPTIPAVLNLEVVRFADDDAAHHAFATIVDRQFQDLATGGDTSQITRASSRELGDERLAFSGPLLLTDPSVPVRQLLIGLAFARDGEFVLSVGSVSLTGDPLIGIFDVMETMIGSSPGPETTPVGDEGMRTGGLWDMLPSLDEVPEGLVFGGDSVPMPFEALPEQIQKSAPNLEPRPDVDPVGLRHVGLVADKWSIKVLKTFADPRDADPTADWFNDWLDENPPPDGIQMLVVRIRVTDRGSIAGTPIGELTFSLVAADGFVYGDQYTCGIVPGQLMLADHLRPDEPHDANFCWIVATSDIDAVLLRVGPHGSDDDGDQVWFALSK